MAVEETYGGGGLDMPPAAEPDPDVADLDPLVGTWRVSGGAEGTATYEWMEGRNFLLQRVDLEQYGQRIPGGGGYQSVMTRIDDGSGR